MSPFAVALVHELSENPSLPHLWHLKRCALFERLGEEELAEIEGAARQREFPRGSAVYLPDDAARQVFLLVRGRIKLCHYLADGKESILDFVDPGEIFGELVLESGSESDHRERAEAVEKSVVVMIPGLVVERLLARNPELALGVTKLIGFRRRRVERRLRSLLFRSNRERLSDLLVELAERYGLWTSEGLEIGLRLSHQELANVIGATRETVTVVLGEMQRERLIEVGRKRIVIIKPATFGLSNPVAEKNGRVERNPATP